MTESRKLGEGIRSGFHSRVVASMETAKYYSAMPIPDFRAQEVLEGKSTPCTDRTGETSRASAIPSVGATE